MAHLVVEKWLEPTIVFWIIQLTSNNHALRFNIAGSQGAFLWPPTPNDNIVIEIRPVWEPAATHIQPDLLNQRNPLQRRYAGAGLLNGFAAL